MALGTGDNISAQSKHALDTHRFVPPHPPANAGWWRVSHRQFRAQVCAVPADTAVVCDWYTIPLDLRGDDGGSTTLPSTGVAPMSGGVVIEWWLALAAAGAGALAMGLRRRPAC